MKASGTLLWLYLFRHYNGSHKLSEEHGPTAAKCKKCFGVFFFVVVVLLKR